MRNILQLSVSTVLLASQVHIPFLGDVAATATPDNQAAAGVYEVKLNTNSAAAIEVVGPKKPDYDADVLVPLHNAQAQAAAAAAKKAAVKRRRTVTVRPVVAVQIPGSHADWMRAAGIAASDFGYVSYIIDHESGWVCTKWNYRGSGAYGLGQAMPAGKMAAYGSDYMTNPVTQLRWANAYAVGRYGSWAAAYGHWLARHSW